MKRLFLIALVALGLTSCSKEHEFIGTWENTQVMAGGLMTLHTQFTFKKDNTASLCLKINDAQAKCIDGSFEVPDKGKLNAYFAENFDVDGFKDLSRLTFHPSKKNLFCEELQLTFKPAK